jgi:hypothetical protein
VCELINRLLKDPNWRVRHASLSMLPFLAFILKTPDKFAEALPALQWGAVLGDSISMVRSEMVQVALQIASLPGFLHTGWAVKSLYAQCVEKGLFTSKDYHHRSALLKLLVARDPWDASVTYALSPHIAQLSAQHASAQHGALSSPQVHPSRLRPFEGATADFGGHRCEESDAQRHRRSKASRTGDHALRRLGL